MLLSQLEVVSEVVSDLLRIFARSDYRLQRALAKPRNNNLMNYAGANWLIEALSVGLTMEVRTLPVSRPAEGLIPFPGKVSPVGRCLLT